MGNHIAKLGINQIAEGDGVEGMAAIAGKRRRARFGARIMGVARVGRDSPGGLYIEARVPRVNSAGAGYEYAQPCVTIGADGGVRAPLRAVPLKLGVAQAFGSVERIAQRGRRA